MTHSTDQNYLEDDLKVFVVPSEILEVPDLSIYEKMVYIVIRSHCGKDSTAYPSYATIAKEASMSRDKAIQATKSLLENGLLEKEKRRIVNKHDKVVNTSNVYKIHRPHSIYRGSRSQRLPQSMTTTTLVDHNDYPSRPQRLKQDHLTDLSEQYSLNNNKETSETLTDTRTKEPTAEKTVVVENEQVQEIAKEVEQQLGTSVNSLLSLLALWIEQYGSDYIVQRAAYVRTHATKNPVGAFRKAIEEQWDVSVTNTTPTSKDDRYSAFYKLFPDS